MTSSGWASPMVMLFTSRHATSQILHSSNTFLETSGLRQQARVISLNAVSNVRSNNLIDIPSGVNLTPDSLEQ